jgi:LysM repeat protein
MKFKFLLLTILLSSLSARIFARMAFDSIGVENQNGKKVILHKLDPKDNYFSVGRRYGVSPNAIMELNKGAKMVVGDIIKVPTDLPFSAIKASVANKSVAKNSLSTMQYKVSQGETLFGIAKKFSSTVDELIMANGLKSNTLIPGQILMVKSTNPPAENVAEVHVAEKPAIRQAEQVADKPVVTTPKPVEKPNTKVADNLPGKSVQKAEDTYVEKPEEHDAKVPPTAKRDSTAVVKDTVDFSGHKIVGDRYGLSEKNEENQSVDPNKKLILHRTAPVGTVIKITNPMTNRTTFAKVVGRFTENENTKDVIVVMTKNVAESLGALDKRFHVTISYGIPNE